MVVFAGVRGAYRNDVWWLNWSSLVAVDRRGPSTSARFELASPRPNPARGSVSFDISIPHAALISLVVCDGAGRVVHRIADASFVPGRHVLVWDRRNDDGRAVPSGVYFVRLQAPGVHLSRKTILIQ
jgi:flagellar hook assembly protein FlgD